MSFSRRWRWPLLHAAVVLTLVAGFFLGLAVAPALIDVCHAGLLALGLPWSVPAVELLGRVDKENELLGGLLRDLVPFLPALLNVGVHAAVVHFRRRSTPAVAGARIETPDRKRPLTGRAGRHEPARR